MNLVLAKPSINQKEPKLYALPPSVMVKAGGSILVERDGFDSEAYVLCDNFLVDEEDLLWVCRVNRMKVEDLEPASGVLYKAPSLFTADEWEDSNG